MPLEWSRNAVSRAIEQSAGLRRIQAAESAARIDFASCQALIPDMFLSTGICLEPSFVLVIMNFRPYLVEILVAMPTASSSHTESSQLVPSAVR